MCQGQLTDGARDFRQRIKRGMHKRAKSANCLLPSFMARVYTDAAVRGEVNRSTGTE